MTFAWRRQTPATPARASRQPGRCTRLWRAAATGLLVALSLAGCVSPSGNTTDTPDQGYISGDGTVRSWEESERSEPVTLTGTGVDGEPIDTSTWRGKLVLVNTWFAACPPCRAEAPDLAELATQYAGQVEFLGVNSTDDAATAAAFERTFAVPYSTVLDTDGSAISALQGVVPIQATPTTVVLDAQGRVAARILGRLDRSVTAGLLDDLLGTQPSAPTSSALATGATSSAPAAAGSAESTTP